VPPHTRVVYQVVFMSDGLPTDFVSVGAPAEESHFSAVSSIVNQSAGNIFFHTVYYTSPENDPTRANALGLAEMAERGSGKFVDLEVGETVDIEEMLSEGERKPWIMRHFQVYNLNSAFC